MCNLWLHSLHCYIRSLHYERRNKPPTGFYLFQIQLQSSRLKLPTMRNEQWHKIQKIIEWIFRSECHCNSITTKWIFIRRLWRFFTFHLNYFDRLCVENANRLRVNERRAKSEKTIEAKNEFFLHFNFIEVLNFAFFLHKKSPFHSREWEFEAPSMWICFCSD